MDIFAPPQGVATPADIQRMTGLCFYGVVTAVPGANQFTVPALAYLGAGKFTGSTVYSAYVLRDAGGAAAAPQGEIKAISAYVNATGDFTTAAFSAAVAVGDEILIVHPLLMLAVGLSVVSQPGEPARTTLNAVLTDLADILAGATGILHFPAAAAAADGISLAEVVRYIQETVLGYEGATSLANKLTAARAAKLDLIGASVALQPSVETLTYEPNYQDTGDLEAATKAISAVAKGAADYSAALTLTAPSDARLIIKTIAPRLTVITDSYNAGATALNYSVRVDVDDVDHEILTGSFAAPAATQNTGQTLSTSLKPVAFALMKNGAAHTYYFYFWVDAGNVVISKVQLTVGVGAYGVYAGANCITVDHSGDATLYAETERLGSGSLSAQWNYTGKLYQLGGAITNGTYCRAACLINDADVEVWSSVATDVVYMKKLIAFVRNN